MRGRGVTLEVRCLGVGKSGATETQIRRSARGMSDLLGDTQAAEVPTPGAQPTRRVRGGWRVLTSTGSPEMENFYPREHLGSNVTQGRGKVSCGSIS